MKVVIAGSRTITDYAIVDAAMTEAVRQGIVPTEVVPGCCRGTDRLGEAWAWKHGIPIKRFPADWAGLGRAAGPVRNGRMARYSDALVLLWDGRSRGSLSMMNEATAACIRIYVHPIGEKVG